jgi:hypothetical protein
MRSRTQTSTTLLEGLKDAHNRTVWAHYVDRYRPLILSYLRRLGLTAADGEDVSQEALFAFAESYRAGSYDRQRGKLRDWLQGIVRHKLQARKFPEFFKTSWSQIGSTATASCETRRSANEPSPIRLSGAIAVACPSRETTVT